MRQVWIIWYAVLLHITWGCLLLASMAPYGETTLHVFRGVPRGLMALVLFAASGLAIWGVTRRRPTWQGLLSLLPQQAILTFSAYAAVVAVVASHYGDGVHRPRLFILADQAPALLVVVLHTIAVIDVHTSRHRTVGDALHASLDELDTQAERLRRELKEKTDQLQAKTDELQEKTDELQEKTDRVQRLPSRAPPAARDNTRHPAPARSQSRPPTRVPPANGP